MLTSLLMVVTLASPLEGAVWKGEFTVKIIGVGKGSGPGPSNGTWDISREARGTIILDRSFAGAGIARTPDSKNTNRYESWISDTKRPIEMRIHDFVTVRGPMFAANQIRFDTIRYNAPEDQKSKEWQAGKVGSAILQFDFDKGTFEFETPRIYSDARSYFKREFVAGPKSWTSRKPIEKDEKELEFEIIHGLDQPKEWFKISGPFKRDQSEIVIHQKCTFGPPLGASILHQKVNAEFKLTLRKE